MTTALSSIEAYSTTLNVTHYDRVAVVVAHPDDGVLLDSGIRTVLDAGAHLVIITATSGEASDRGNVSDLRNGIRLQEDRATWDMYGIPRDSLVHLGLRDGQLHHEFARRRLARCIGAAVATHQINKVVTLGEEAADDHPDHLATHEATLAVAGLNRNLQVVGLTKGTPDVILPANLNRKLAAWSHHKTQFHIVPAAQRDAAPTGWVQMGDFYVREDSAQLLKQYHLLTHSHEPYQQYFP